MDCDISLRPLRVEDAATSYIWRNDADLWRFTGSRPDREVTIEMEREWAEKVIADPTRSNYAIMCGDRYIGNIYLINISGDRAELGIVIGDRAAHGHGYGRKAIEMLKVEAFKLGIKTIYIEMRTENTPALITYLKCGAKLPETGGGFVVLTLDV